MSNPVQYPVQAPVPPRLRRRSFAGPFVLIVLGIVFLLGNLHMLSWMRLATLFAHYWPLLLILWEFACLARDDVLFIDSTHAVRIGGDVVHLVLDVLPTLKAGVMEEGVLTHPDTGTPQGGVISPLLANVYLHEVLDRWFETEVRPRLVGRATLIRYADDFVIAFSSEADARRVMEVLPRRFGKYALTLHPEKTRLVPFHRPPSPGAGKRDARPGTFDLLGFTHYWGRSYRGYLLLKRQTARTRFRRALAKATLWCRMHRHLSIAEQQRSLNLGLRGHYGYYGITGNFLALMRFKDAVQTIWRKWLNRRSQRARMDWVRFHALLKRYPLAPPRVVQSVYRAASP